MSKKNTARYAVTFGLSGCYMPDSYSGAYECATRADLANLIRSELRLYGLPASLFREVRIRKLWQYIKRRGSSVAHFAIVHKGHSLSFTGLTESEYLEASAE